MHYSGKCSRLQNKDLRSKFKDAMAIDYNRGGNPRCPSLILGGLMIVLLFFACSWWSLTSQNFELLNQIENLEEQLRLSGEIFEKCSQAKDALEERAKAFQAEASQVHVRYEQLKVADQEAKENLKKAHDDTISAKKRIATLESTATLMKTELESLKKLSEAKNKSLEVLRMEKKTLSTRLEEEKAKVESLEARLAELTNSQGSKPNINDPVVKMLHNAANKENDPISAGVAVDGNHADADAQDADTAAEERPDSAVEPMIAAGPENIPVDPRELAMADKANIANHP